ncbi:mismatch repair ATPase [Bellilinea caldifistulae]|nr:mismatch repair ATPase [Bellilinea caldifistulae]
MDSIGLLYPSPQKAAGVRDQPPAYFRDLNLDQIVDWITASKQDYDLKPDYYTAVQDEETIRFRQEIVRDLMTETTLIKMQTFAAQMVILRRYQKLSSEIDHQNHREGWFLEAALVYVRSVLQLEQDLSSADLQSRGLLAFRQILGAYTASSEFQRLRDEAEQLKKDLSTVRYCVLIKDTTVKVRPYDGETDYSIEVEKTFEKFKQGAVKDYLVKLNIVSSMNHVEAQILDLVARLNPELFERLHRFCAEHSRFMADFILTFDREMQFYVAYLETILPLMKGGLKFCLPAVSIRSKEVLAAEAFDLALAIQLRGEIARIVPNDFQLSGNERVIIVSGPNQGGKSTFLRSIGQAQVMMQSGMFVAAEQFTANLCSGVFTHYKRREDSSMKSGKLDEELSRMSAIADHIRPHALVLFNESFAATNEREGAEIARQITLALLERKIKVFFVTHQFTLADGFYKQGLPNALFLRAERKSGGRRTYKLFEGQPLQTSFGEDVYRTVFESAP